MGFRESNSASSIDLASSSVIDKLEYRLEHHGKKPFSPSKE
jgi:hypothetical protein